ncbi:MAG: hypothetical protein JWP09_471 [Candidatus Taylorbacteria bacterium]|nr:hypothetical protein [Candidatus Taylorbacteria bacterium]
MENTKKNQLIIPSVIIGLAIVITSIVLNYSASLFANKNDTIAVTGTAERVVDSDTAKWQITVNIQSKTIEAGTPQVNSAVQKIEQYLTSHNINPSQVILGTLSNIQHCVLSSQGYENCSLGISSYTLNQTITVESDDVKNIDLLSKDITTNLSSIDYTQNVEYYYNNLKNIRADMLSEATKNALDRAQNVAEAGGAKIGKITSLSSGVFQVTAENSVNYDDSGSYDTSIIKKKITATVKANFSVR